MMRCLAVMLAAVCVVGCEPSSGGGDADPDGAVGGDTADDPPPADGSPEPEPDADLGPEPDAGAEPEPDTGAEPEPDAGPDAGPEPEPDAGPDPEPDAAPEPEPEPDASPAAAGPMAVETIDVEIDIGPRDGLPEQIPATVYHPVGDGPYPLVVFSHGFSLPPSAYADYGRRLASHGISTVMPRYDDSPFAARSHVGLMRDTIAVVDWMLASRWSDDLDPDAIALAGHSRGGKQSIHAATVDDRIGAVLGLDPVDSAPPFSDPAANPSVAPELMGDLRVPSAFVGSGLGAQGFQPCAPDGENYDAYYAAAPPPTARYLIAEAGHQDFVDTCAAGSMEITCTICPSGGIAADVHAFGVTLTTAFIGLHLAGRDDFAPWVDGAELAALDFVDRQARE